MLVILATIMMRVWKRDRFKAKKYWSQLSRA